MDGEQDQRISCPVCGRPLDVTKRVGTWTEAQAMFASVLRRLTVQHLMIGRILGTSQFAVKRLFLRLDHGRWPSEIPYHGKVETPEAPASVISHETAARSPIKITSQPTST